jgi:hypothetical protein
MKKLLVVLVILFVAMSSGIALADNTVGSGDKIKISSFEDKLRDTVFNAEIDKLEWAITKLPELIFVGADGKVVTGTMLYPNRSEVKLGDFDLQWVFTPDDPKYETRTGVFRFYIWPADTEEQKGKLPEITPDEPTTPSLTATTVQLTKLTAYDINLNNKISGTTYKWTSSNEKVAKVNPKNGFVSAVSEGTATITCAMTFPDGSAQELTSVVSINYDDNATVLSDTVLDLDTGDKYTLKVENAPARAKYKFASSDKSIVTVGTTNGKVTAVSSGDAYITCTITADNQVIVLRCDVSVSD